MSPGDFKGKLIRAGDREIRKNLEMSPGWATLARKSEKGVFGDRVRGLAWGKLPPIAPWLQASGDPLGLGDVCLWRRRGDRERR